MTVQVTRLPSGLSVVTDDMPHLQTASLGVWIGSGSRDEQKDDPEEGEFQLLREERAAGRLVHKNLTAETQRRGETQRKAHHPEKRTDEGSPMGL